MPNFFKRGSKTRQEKVVACATDSNRHQQNIENKNSFSEGASEAIVSEQIPITTTTAPTKCPKQSQQRDQNENVSTSVGERVSNFMNGFLNIMAKGKNRRNHGGKRQQQKHQPPNQQNQKNKIQTHLEPEDYHTQQSDDLDECQPTDRTSIDSTVHEITLDLSTPSSLNEHENGTDDKYFPNLNNNNHRNKNNDMINNFHHLPPFNNKNNNNNNNHDYQTKYETESSSNEENNSDNSDKRVPNKILFNDETSVKNSNDNHININKYDDDDQNNNNIDAVATVATNCVVKNNLNAVPLQKTTINVDNNNDINVQNVDFNNFTNNINSKEEENKHNGLSLCNGSYDTSIDVAVATVSTTTAVNNASDIVASNTEILNNGINQTETNGFIKTTNTSNNKINDNLTVNNVNLAPEIVAATEKTLEFFNNNNNNINFNNSENYQNGEENTNIIQADLNIEKMGQQATKQQHTKRNNNLNHTSNSNLVNNFERIPQKFEQNNSSATHQKPITTISNENKDIFYEASSDLPFNDKLEQSSTASQFISDDRYVNGVDTESMCRTVDYDSPLVSNEKSVENNAIRINVAQTDSNQFSHNNKNDDSGEKNTSEPMEGKWSPNFGFVSGTNVGSSRFHIKPDMGLATIEDIDEEEEEEEEEEEGASAEDGEHSSGNERDNEQDDEEPEEIDILTIVNEGKVEELSDDDKSVEERVKKTGNSGVEIVEVVETEEEEDNTDDGDEEVEEDDDEEIEIIDEEDGDRVTDDDDSSESVKINGNSDPINARENFWCNEKQSAFNQNASNQNIDCSNFKDSEKNTINKSTDENVIFNNKNNSNNVAMQHFTPHPTDNFNDVNSFSDNHNVNHSKHNNSNIHSQKSSKGSGDGSQKVHRIKIFSDESMRLPDIVVETTGMSANDLMQQTDSSNDTSEEEDEDQTNGDDSSNCTNENANDKNVNEISQHETKLYAQIKEAETNAINCQTKVNDLSYKLTELERDISLKNWNIERLQAELYAANKEGDCVKMKLREQETDLDTLRIKLSEREDELNLHYNDLEVKYTELQEKFDQMQKLAITLQVQLAEAQSDATSLRNEKERLIKERDIESQALQDALDAAIIERAENDAKWQRDFEQLRTVNSDREELLLQDCEWKLRATEKSCKVRIAEAERLKKDALEKASKVEKEAQEQIDKIKHLKTYEAEVAQLRGLTGEQRESINTLTNQLQEIKFRLEDATEKLEEAMKKIEKMTVQHASDLSDKDRHMAAKMDEARGAVAVMWEDRLLNEMLRLKIELETCYAEDRADALKKAHEEHIEEINRLKETYSFKEQMLQDEMESIKLKLADRNRRLDEANEKADKQIMQIRMILDKSERNHQREIDAEINEREENIKKLHSDFEARESALREQYDERIKDIQHRFAEELNSSRIELEAKYKKDFEVQFEKMCKDKDEAYQDLERIYKRKLVDANTRIQDVEITHQRELKDIQNNHSMERSTLEQRDLHNSQEIEALHRKCRCLTKLFEEMRFRYERRDPRAEDIREIEELRSIVEAQDRDLRKLTEQLRSMQIGQSIQFEPITVKQPPPSIVGPPPAPVRKNKRSKINCDVIYEEPEEHAAINE